MLPKNSYSKNQLRDYSALFSRAEVQSWLKSDFSSIDYKIDHYNPQIPVSHKTSYLQYLKYIYGILEQHYQNEYVIKNSFLNEWLIRELGKTNSIVFNEFRVGDAIADLVMFNGVSKAFEIKTEYDTDQRLDLQLQNYRRAFNQIYLIVPESKLNIYDKYDSDIGLITYKGQVKNKFCKYREAVGNMEIDPETIMHIFHTSEYKKVVKAYYGELPKMTSFNQFKICSQLIVKIPAEDLNFYFIEQMKSRKMENSYSERYFREFNQLFLALKLKKTTRKKLLNNLKAPLIR